MNLFQKGLYWVKGYATGNTIFDIQSELTDKEIVGEEINFRSILNLGYTKGSEDHHNEFSNKTTMLGVIVELPDGVVGVVKGFDNGSFNYVNNIVDVKTNKPIKSQQNLSHNWFTRFNIIKTTFPYKATCILSTSYKESDYYIRIYKAIDTSNKYAYCITSNNKKLTDDNLIGGFISDEIIEPEMVDEKLQPITEKYKYESSNSNSSMNIDEEVERKLESIKDYFSEENVVDIDKLEGDLVNKLFVSKGAHSLEGDRFKGVPISKPLRDIREEGNIVELPDSEETLFNTVTFRFFNFIGGVNDNFNIIIRGVTDGGFPSSKNIFINEKANIVKTERGNLKQGNKKQMYTDVTVVLSRSIDVLKDQTDEVAWEDKRFSSVYIGVSFENDIFPSILNYKVGNGVLMVNSGMGSYGFTPHQSKVLYMELGYNKPKGYIENNNKKRFHVVRNSLPIISPFEEVPDYS